MRYSKMHVRRTGRIRLNPFVLVVLVILAAFSIDSALADGFRFRLNLSYVNGVQDLVDQYEEDIEIAESDEFFDVDVDTWVWPVGVSLFPYYQWDSGLLFGAGIGPFMYIVGDGWADDYSHWQLPLSANIGYVFAPDDPVSFYVRGGPSYHVAGGDFYDGSNLGFVGAVGLEFLKKDNVAFGVEVAYDSAEVDIDDLRTGGTKGIKAAEFSVGLFIQLK
jgi:hypothetical protein